jgi:hypothetical protein
VYERILMESGVEKHSKIGSFSYVSNGKSRDMLYA